MRQQVEWVILYRWDWLAYGRMRIHIVVRVIWQVQVWACYHGGRKLQRDGVKKSDNAETKAVEYESFESNNIKPIAEHWERKLYVLNVFQEMYNNTEGYKDVYIPMSERRVQWQRNEDKEYLQQRTKITR